MSTKRDSNKKWREEYDAFILKVTSDPSENIDYAQDVNTSEGLKHGDHLIYATHEQFREIKLIEGDFIRAWYIDEKEEWGYESFCANHGMYYLNNNSFKDPNALQGVGILYPAYDAPEGRHLCFSDFKSCAEITFKR